jgi:hypothetical protein
LQEWQEIFVVLCTFANREEFPGLAEQLGARLEFQSTVEEGSDDAEAWDKAYKYRKNATLTYLASAHLERLINIWIEESVVEENRMIADSGLATSYYSAHAHALQSFIEKVTVFRSATEYKDDQLTAIFDNDTAAVKTYKLANLYDRYFEYANFLSTDLLRTINSNLDTQDLSLSGLPYTIDELEPIQRLSLPWSALTNLKLYWIQIDCCFDLLLGCPNLIQFSCYDSSELNFDCVLSSEV